ncbi:MAG: methionine--tRNA ligase [Bacteroidota bacterium]|nr:methionine--tRNA ligase [Bacteroidota bacterium]
MSQKRITVTSALLYANGPLHLGHVAGAYLPADIFVRYQKLKGEDVLFICGSDEHGAAITLQAKKEKITPKEIVDKYHKMNKETFEKFGIDFSIYHRTTEKIHHETATDFFLKLESKNGLIKHTTQQFYDNKYNQFLADRYICGECPKCNYENAYGDQCEKCGSALSPNELLNPKSTLSGKSPVMKETTHWYLQMQKHEAWLKKWLEEGVLDDVKIHNPKEWRSQVLGQCKSWIDGGLKERAMTRDLDWGVKVPLKNAKNKVLYVWLDAPIGYISATKEWAKQNGKNWEDYWQEKETDLIHFIGKDNIVFHCIIFPIILKIHGNYILPKNVPANEFLTLEGGKLSTSRNWAIWMHEYLEDFKGYEDAMRYVLCSTSPENKDTDFTWKDFQARNNNELVSIYGNFINRVLVLTNKYWDGIVPHCGSLNKYDKEIINKLIAAPKKIGEHISKYQFKDALTELMNLARVGNKYLTDMEPWKLYNSNPKRTETIIYICLQITSALCVLSNPFMPFSSKKLKAILNLKQMKWHDVTFGILKSESQIQNIEHLFHKVEDLQINKQLKKLHS